MPVAGRDFARPRGSALFLAVPLPFFGPALLLEPLALLGAALGALALRGLGGLPCFTLGWCPRSVHAWQNHSPCVRISPGLAR